MTSTMASTGATIADDFMTVQKKKKTRTCIAPLHSKPPIMAREGKTSTGILSGGIFSFQDGAAAERQGRTAAANAAAKAAEIEVRR